MSRVLSLLPPSTTTTSSKPDSTARASVVGKLRSSFRVGITTEMVMAPYSILEVLNMKKTTRATVAQKMTCLCQKRTSP